MPHLLNFATAALLGLLTPTAIMAEPLATHGIPSTDRLIGVATAPAHHDGRSALKIELSEEEQSAQLAGAGGNRPTFAIFDIPFSDGIIEVDVAADINGMGGKDARGFAGIAFHVSETGEEFEAVYLRMSNGTGNVPPPPAPRNVRAVQYISHPGFHFPQSRAARPAHYEKAADIALGRWHRLRLEISGTQLTALVDGNVVLEVDDLRRAGQRGLVGLWVGDGTTAHFANLEITEQIDPR